MKTLPLLILLVLLSLAVLSACQASAPMANEKRLELIEEIKAFEKEFDFLETDNFRNYSPEIGAYDYLFYTPSTHLPYSLNDPTLILPSVRGKALPSITRNTMPIFIPFLL